MNEMNVMLGCDPEFFIKKNGKFVCAHGIIPGTKRNPHEIDCGAVQVDGYALEFNTLPARNPEQFCMNVSQVLAVMRKMVDKKYAFALGTPVAHSLQNTWKHNIQKLMNWDVTLIIMLGVVM